MQALLEPSAPRAMMSNFVFLTRLQATGAPFLNRIDRYCMRAKLMMDQLARDLAGQADQSFFSPGFRSRAACQGLLFPPA